MSLSEANTAFYYNWLEEIRDVFHKKHNLRQVSSTMIKKLLEFNFC
jgi:hypothetical protein